MNNMKGMIVKNYVMHLTMMILSAVVSFVGSATFGSILGALIYVTYLILEYGDGADRGERACTLSVTVEKIKSENRDVDEKLLSQTYSPKRAFKAFLISALPFALLAAVNLAFAKFGSIQENTLGSITRIVFMPVAWFTRICNELVGWNLDGLFKNTEMLFSAFGTYGRGLDLISAANAVSGVATYAVAYDTHYIDILRISFIIFSFLPPLAMFIGYLQGPKLRVKKLEAIQKGSRRKQKKLKVHQNKKPRTAKPEV